MSRRSSAPEKAARVCSTERGQRQSARSPGRELRFELGVPGCPLPGPARVCALSPAVLLGTIRPALGKGLEGSGRVPSPAALPQESTRLGKELIQCAC